MISIMTEGTIGRNRNDGKDNEEKRGGEKRYLLKFILIIALGTGIYYFLTSPLFDIQKLTVINNQYYTEQQVISIAEARVRESVQSPTSEIKDKLLKDPYIKNAKVEQNCPMSLSLR